MSGRSPASGSSLRGSRRCSPNSFQVDARGFKTVNYQGLIAPLIEAVKELDDRLRAVEARFADLSPHDEDRAEAPRFRSS